MKSRKKLICLAVAASLVMGAAFSGCTAVINEADVKQTVATVDISKTDAFTTEFGEEYKAAVTEKSFLKRDMLSAYYNSYTNYTQMGYTYAQIFEMIKDSLVANAVTIQYATVYLLYNMDDASHTALTEYLSKQTEADKCEYILNHYDDSAVKRAEYTLKVTLNSVLDSAERNLPEIKDMEEKEDDEYTGSGTRSTPTGIDATVEEYVPEFYNVYTGYEGYLLTEEPLQKAVKNKDYEPVYGTTAVTRQKAYGSFLGSLKSNYLLADGDTETTDIWELSYVQESYVSQLQSEIISAYQDKITEEKESIIDDAESGNYDYVENQYNRLLKTQTADYATTSAFESAMGSMSDSSFVLYSPSTKRGESDTENRTFGYVYNILLPFSSLQSAQLAVLQSDRDKEIISDSEYFFERNKLLKNIQTTDQRSAWFNGSTDYSFSVSEYETEAGKTLNYYGRNADDSKNRDYLFFKNNVTDTEHAQYEALEKYAGLYSYNGTVRENADGSYTLIPNKLSIDGMLNEFSAYINYVLGGSKVEFSVVDDYYDFNKNNDKYTIGNTKEIDYSKLVYATGSVNLGDNANRENMFVTDKEHMTDRYKVMSAVNELQYAYTTDTGVLSQYIGYTVSAYDTNYIKEFEYAAQWAVKQGAGTFAVCAGDYGWHLIYVTETFDVDGGAVYKNANFSKAQVEKEGTFENRFYNWIKDSHLAQEVTLKSNKVAKEYNTDKAVTVYTDAYKDLT